MPYSSLAPSFLSYFNPTYFISIMAHLYSLFDLYIPYGNFNFTLVLVLKFPGSLNLSFHNLSIHQFSRKNLSLAQFIPRIYNKIIIKILGYFWGVTKAVEVPKKNVIQPNPIDLDTTANAQDTKYPLPVAPSDDQVYILPTPAEKSKPAAPAPKGKSNPSLQAMLQNFRKLVAIAQIFATTSNKMATAYIAWHSGWFGCEFGFGTPGPRHF